MTNTLWRLSAVVVFLSCCGGAFASEHPPTGIADEHLRQAALRMQRDQARNLVLLQDAKMTIFLERLLARLWSHAGSDKPMVRLQVVQNAIENAWTYPDGAIYLTAGMVARTRNEDQLALILAHEIIHYQHNHAMGAFHQVQSTDPRNTGDIRKDLAGWLEAAERQADKEGLALMLAAGYCPARALWPEEQPQTDAPGADMTFWEKEGAFEVRLSQIKHLLMLMPAGANCRDDLDGRQHYASQIAPAILADAMSALQLGLWDQAGKSVQRYLAVVPDDPQAHYLQGEIAYRYGKRMKMAISCYTKAIAIDQTFAPAHRALGIVHLKAGHLQEARDWFRASLVLAPHAAENEYIRGYLKLCSE